MSRLENVHIDGFFFSTLSTVRERSGYGCLGIKTIHNQALLPPALVFVYTYMLNTTRWKQGESGKKKEENVCTGEQIEEINKADDVVMFGSGL